MHMCERQKNDLHGDYELMGATVLTVLHLLSLLIWYLLLSPFSRV